MIPTGPNYITKIGVRIFFNDARNRKQKVSGSCDVWFDGIVMGIIARKLAEKLKSEKFKRKYDALAIPEMTEKNLYEIYDLARQYKGPWWYLLNLRLSLENIRSRGYGLKWGVGGVLTLDVDSPHGTITLWLTRQRFNQRARSPILDKIEDFINNYNPISYDF